MPARAEHRLWLHRAARRRLPLADPLPVVRKGPGPRYPGLSYYDVDGHTVWLLPSDWGSRWALGHELGHAFASQRLTTRELRQAAGRVVGHPGLRWFWGTWNPLRHFKQPNEENFADCYAELFCHAPYTKRERRLERFLHDLR